MFFYLKIGFNMFASDIVMSEFEDVCGAEDISVEQISLSQFSSQSQYIPSDVSESSEVCQPRFFSFLEDFFFLIFLALLKVIQKNKSKIYK